MLVAAPPAITTYSCSKCELAVLVLPDQEPVKGCKCEAPILAHCHANVHTHTVSGPSK